MSGHPMPMPAINLSRFLNPWKHRRDEHRRRVDALRQRDGDACRRCRRPLRFELAEGHDHGIRIEQMVSASGAEPSQADDLANLCLTHRRCNVPGRDHTGEVLDRLRPAREAELFAKARERQAA